RLPERIGEDVAAELDRVGAAVDDERHPGLVRRAAGAGDVVGVFPALPDAVALAVDHVLDVRPDRTGLEQAGDQLVRFEPVPGLDVRAHRDPHRAGDGAHHVEVLAEVHVLAVGATDGIGHRVTAHGESGESRLGGDTGAPRVPDGRQHQELPGVVSVCQVLRVRGYIG